MGTVKLKDFRPAVMALQTKALAKMRDISQGKLHSSYWGAFSDQLMESGRLLQVIDANPDADIASLPPSAPVGVGVGDKDCLTTRARELLADEYRKRGIGTGLVNDAGTATNVAIAAIATALAQQPAAAGEEIMVNAAHDVYTLPLQPSGLSSGPRFVVHVPGPEQPAAVDGPNAWRAAFIAERATRYREGGMKIEQARIHAETDATLMEQIARQQQGGSDDA